MLAHQAFPDEMILHVISFLHTLGVKRLAETYCRRITLICLPVLRKRLCKSANDRKMMALFGAVDVDFFEQDFIDEVFKLYTSVLGEHSSPPTAPVERRKPFDYLHLKGDLHWLQELRPFDRDINDNYGLPTEADMLSFEAACEKLNLVLSRAFSQLIRDVHLKQRCFTGIVYWLNFIGRPVSLIRMISMRESPIEGAGDDGIDGYAVPFATCCGGWCWFLYMDTDGGHCILCVDGPCPVYNYVHEPPEELYDTRRLAALESICTRAEIEAGIELTWEVPGDEPAYLHATSFEEFLVRLYFAEYTEWLIYCKPPREPDQIPGDLKEYLIRMYTEKGRNHPSNLALPGSNLVA